MKFVLIIILLCSSVFAAEVSTDCPAMNSSREKNPKEFVTKKGKTSGSQVVSQ